MTISVHRVGKRSYECDREYVGSLFSKNTSKKKKATGRHNFYSPVINYFIS